MHFLSQTLCRFCIKPEFSKSKLEVDRTCHANVFCHPMPTNTSGARTARLPGLPVGQLYLRVARVCTTQAAGSFPTGTGKQQELRQRGLSSREYGLKTPLPVLSAEKRPTRLMQSYSVPLGRYVRNTYFGIYLAIASFSWKHSNRIPNIKIL